MASVKYSTEYEILMGTITSASTTVNPIAQFKTGPFTKYIDAYIFAAAIGIATQKKTAKKEFDKKKKETIKDIIFNRAAGGDVLPIIVTLLDQIKDPHDRNDLEAQLTNLSNLNNETNENGCLEILDLYADQGLSYLNHRLQENQDPVEIIFAAIDHIKPYQFSDLPTEVDVDPLDEIFS